MSPRVQIPLRVRNTRLGSYSSRRARPARFSVVPRSIHAGFGSILGVALVLSSLMLVQASNPSAASIGPTSPPVTWVGTAIGGAATGADTCTEGVSCDTFTLTVTGDPADWTGKLISVKIAWTVPLNDYDLFLHKDSNTGPEVGQSADGAPDTEEISAIDPSSTGTGVYTVQVVYFAVTPLIDQFQATAEVKAKPASRAASYLKGGITFSPSVAAKAPVAAADGEPSIRTDKFGNTYAAGIRGVPAGTDLWYFDLNPTSPTYDPKMRNPIYRGQPDSFTQNTATSVGADGGGDVDLAVGFDSPAPGQPPTLAVTSLALVNVSSSRSTNRGQTFTLNPLGSSTGGIPIDDRQWIEFLGKDKVYLLYRTIAPAVTQIQRSEDGGLTYGPAVTAGAIGQVGYIDVHQASGTVYISGSTGQVCVGSPLLPGLPPLTYQCSQAATDPGGVAHLFFVVKVADDGTPNGTAYVAYSNDKDIFLAHSTDKGSTWSQPVRVSDGPETRTSLFPWIETGPTPGSVGVVWYGTSEATNNDNADWQVFYAQSFNASSATPTFRQVVAGDHIIHGSNISEGGTLGTANRNLLDYFQVSFDPTGAAVIAYTDDHNDFDGHTFVTRQIGGPSIKGGTVPFPTEGPGLPPPPAPPADGSQVVDFAQDVAIGLLGVVPVNDPLDILGIKYTCENGPDGPVIVATMKVSDLSSVPLVSNWRMNFTANAPLSLLSPTGDYTFGLSDRGDQFFVRASTDPLVTPFSFGTAVRNSDGSIAYTIQGAADSGSFDTANNTITVKVAASKLNPFVTHGPPIGVGSTFVGLRGQAFTSGANIKADLTRGGTQFTIGSCATGLGVGGGGGGGGNNGPILKTTSGGSILSKVVSFSFKADRSLSGHLNYKDKQQGIHLVSDRFLAFAQTGPNQVTFRGTGRIGSDTVNFEVICEDNGDPGNNDFFRIAITGVHNSTRQGNLSQGNIQAHR